MATSTGDMRMKSANNESQESYPKEIAGSLKGFKDSLHAVDNVLSPLMNASMPDVHNQLSALDRAKLDLVSAYAINSLFWVYLCTQGVNPREHPIRHELGRIQKYMKRAQEITDKEKAAKLDKGAAKRFIRNALSDPTEKVIPITVIGGLILSSVGSNYLDHKVKKEKQRVKTSELIRGGD